MKQIFSTFLILISFVVYAQPIDPDATIETRNLFYNLQNVAKGNLLFGHEDALAYGLNEDGSRWIDQDDRSDVKSITGSHPAVYGWEIGRLELEDSAANIDDVNFERMKYWIRTGYERGGIISVSWHSNNPQTGGDTWDTGSNAPSHVIPGGDKHEMYMGWLDRVAEFALDLKDSVGNFVPVIFRPYHEHTGTWFWWGKNSCTIEEYVQLWRFTVDYLKDVKGIHHFLYAYSPSDVSSESAYLERYPGDDYVDILGTDDYNNIYSSGDKSRFLTNLRIAVNLANQKGKIAALTETGYERIPDSDWFSTRVVEPIKEDSIARQIAYFLVWRNGRPDHYYAPYPGHSAAADLTAIFEDPFVQFESELDGFYKDPAVSILKQLPDLSLEAGTDIKYDLNLAQYFGGATTYELVHNSNQEIATVVVANDILGISPLGEGGKGVYRIKASSTNQSMSLMFQIEVVEEEEEEEEEVLSATKSHRSITVFPNPVGEILKIKNGEKFDFYEIHDAAGRKIQSAFLDGKELEVSHLKRGSYFLSLRNEDRIIIRRFRKK